uniref:Uncharacterized protein n=1 Tax=Arundo donax TaxID=35708 RepID=A0A0A8ZD48_ARUDO
MPRVLKFLCLRQDLCETHTCLLEGYILLQVA